LNNILKNDIEKMRSNDPLIHIIQPRIKLINDVKNGILNLNSNGSFWYKSKSKEIEKDSFSYQVITDYGKSEKINVKLDNKNFPLQKEKDYGNVFRPIYFNYDKSDIRKQFIPRLDSIVKVLNNNQNLKIEISSFADCRGSKEYNLILTERRNKSIIDYIRSRINYPERIEGKGYGESQVPGNSDKNCGNRSETFHQKNRKTTFKISDTS